MRVFYILRRDFGNTLAVNARIRHARVKRERREYGKFIRRVVTLDVGGRVGFRKAERLRLL